MNRRLLSCALACQLIYPFTLISFGQIPASSPSPQQQTPRPSQQQQTPSVPPVDEDTVKITTNLVQVDAVITDQHGKLVTDLRPDEVQILEDGRAQKITNFTLVNAGMGAGSPGAALPAKSSTAVDKNAPPAPPVTLTPETVRRTIALVVDDLGLSAESISFVRRALRKFVDEEIQLGDLIAIIRTGSGVGALQQFTTDKRILHAVIDRIRWNPMGRAGADAVPRIESNPAALLPPEEEAEVLAFLARSERFREDTISSGTLGTLNYVVRGLGELPGRKSVLLISDGIKIFTPTDRIDTSSRVLEAMRGLSDLANRASVVIHSMDARGLQTLTQTAADRLNLSRRGPVQAQLKALMGPRVDDFNESQNGLNFLAQQTGGIFVRNRNDLNEGLHRVMEDQKGYYLIGYRPDESTFDSKNSSRKFHALTLKVMRAGKFDVRMRKGFYGFPGMSPKPQAGTSQQVVNALTSPFGAAGVQVRLTSAFANDAQAGSLLSSMLHVRASDLTFSNEPDDWHKAEFDIIAITYGDNGRVIDQLSRTDSINMRGATYQHMLKEGFVYSVNVPIKKPGAYQLRVALRDHGSERVGSASQFVEIPDMKSDRLLLSGVLLSVLDPSGLQKPEMSASSKDLEVLDQANRAALRKFRQGEYLQYGATVYNAQLDKTTGRPRLQITVRLFGDGRSVFSGQPLNVNVTNSFDLNRISAAGAIQLGTDMVPGEYVLQVIVTDLLADPKQRRTTQFIDFEIVK